MESAFVLHPYIRDPLFKDFLCREPAMSEHSYMEVDAGLRSHMGISYSDQKPFRTFQISYMMTHVDGGNFGVT